MADDLTAIKVSTARIEEQVKALSEATRLQHQNLSQHIEKLAGKEALADLDDRVVKLEKAHGWVIKGIIGTAATALVSATGALKKLGLS